MQHMSIICRNMAACFAFFKKDISIHVALHLSNVYVFTESVILVPFRWPATPHDITLATEVTACNPVKSSDWENIAA